MSVTEEVVCYLGVGSNVGDREATIARAVELLGACEGVRVCAVSSLYETEPVGGPPQGKYLNGAIEVVTSLAPLMLLDVVQDIERRLGRVRGERWGPRTIDLDILLYGDRVVGEERLSIPHPLLHEREFVLVPLEELAPEAVHPVLGRSIRELLRTKRAGGETWLRR